MLGLITPKNAQYYDNIAIFSSYMAPIIDASYVNASLFCNAL